MGVSRARAAVRIEKGQLAESEVESLATRAQRVTGRKIRLAGYNRQTDHFWLEWRL
jgi:hypothetical protein